MSPRLVQVESWVPPVRFCFSWEGKPAIIEANKIWWLQLLSTFVAAQQIHSLYKLMQFYKTLLKTCQYIRGSFAREYIMLYQSDTLWVTFHFCFLGDVAVILCNIKCNIKTIDNFNISSTVYDIVRVFYAYDCMHMSQIYLLNLGSR